MATIRPIILRELFRLISFFFLKDLFHDFFKYKFLFGHRDDRRQLVTISRCSSTASSNNNNWLADLSVEVCKVETIEEDGSENSGASGGGGVGGGDCGASDDWDESVFFEAAAAAAASCCASGQSNHLHSNHHHHHHHQHDVTNNLDVLLGNPNLHHSSALSHSFPNFCFQIRLFKLF
jgi:hypothetical protein